MLSREENELLTRTNADTPWARLARRYWLPALLSEELPEPDGAPIRVKLMGERLVAFRRTDGQVGLVGEFCPHRGASLVLARNEDNALPLHLPRLADRLRRHRAGHAYRKGSQRLQRSPAPGRLSDPRSGRHGVDVHGSARDATAVSSVSMEYGAGHHVYSVKILQESNFVQGLEGGLDPIHVQFLHRQTDGSRLGPAQRGTRWRGRYGARPLHGRHAVRISVGGHPRPRRSERGGTFA